jgi:outer membrane PBP1 activator LpoA protein
LYALGTDSFALTTQLNQLMVFPALGLRDKSGVLYLTPSQQIARILSWAQFKDGMSVLLGV